MSFIFSSLLNRLLLYLGSSLLILSSLEGREHVYQKPSHFLRAHFNNTLPQTRTLSLTTAHQQRIQRILGHPYQPARVRYWSQGSKTIWILNEIGKTLPITVAYVIEKQQITEVKVLIYRESHGSEVRHPYFTKQFKYSSLTAHGQLNRSINGIAGATLSVRALTKLARVALFFNSQLSV